MPVLDRWDLDISADDVLREQGGDPAAIRSRRPFFVELAEKALEEGLPLLRPVVLYQRFGVEKVSHQRLLLSGGGKIKRLAGLGTSENGDRSHRSPFCDWHRT